MLLVDITANNNDLNWLLRIRDINPIPRLTSYKFVCLFVLVCMSAFCFLISPILLSLLYVCLFVCLSVCMSVCMSVRLSVCLSVAAYLLFIIHSWRPFYPKFYVSLCAGKLLSVSVNCVRTLCRSGLSVCLSVLLLDGVHLFECPL